MRDAPRRSKFHVILRAEQVQGEEGARIAMQARKGFATFQDKAHRNAAHQFIRAFPVPLKEKHQQSLGRK
jgi:hypothetical protein